MISSERPLLLGSGSPRRRNFLEQQGLPFVVRSPHVDESVLAGENALDYVSRMSLTKLVAIREQQKGHLTNVAGVLTADTVVVLGERILTKPQGDEDAVRMLSEMCGRKHQVLTSYSVYSCSTQKELTKVVRTEVTFRAASESTIRNYVACGEGKDKAGAYAIQGRGAFLVRSVEGSPANVVGLPVCEVVVDLLELGLLESYP